MRAYLGQCRIFFKGSVMDCFYFFFEAVVEIVNAAQFYEFVVWEGSFCLFISISQEKNIIDYIFYEPAGWSKPQ
jgi:hypothetical protein